MLSQVTISWPPKHEDFDGCGSKIRTMWGHVMATGFSILGVGVTKTPLRLHPKPELFVTRNFPGQRLLTGTR